MEEAADYYIDSVLQSVADPAVDGTFLDDIGFGGEHAQMLIDTRLTKQEVAAINNASLRTYARLKQRLIAAGKFDWQSLGLGDFAGPGIKRNASTGNLNPFRQSFDLGCKPHNPLLAPGLHSSKSASNHRAAQAWSSCGLTATRATSTRRCCKAWLMAPRPTSPSRHSSSPGVRSPSSAPASSAPSR